MKRILQKTGPRWCARASRSRLIVFTRYPEPGRTKTRLISSLGEKGAAELHVRMTEYTLRGVREFCTRAAMSAEVRYEGGSREKMESWLGEDLVYSVQGEGDLGNRMERACHESIQAGMDRIVIVGTDCPALKTAQLTQAFSCLRKKDLVLGPARDGGYYLIGLKGPACSDLFRGIPWGTNRVLEKTLEVAEKLNVSVKLLEPLDDVDRPEDLVVWEREIQGRGLPVKSLRLSIIIPVHNETGTLEATLQSTQGTMYVSERILVTGGRKDDALRHAGSRGVKVIFSSPGRAEQMNAGAREASGDGLLFLHADTCLPRGFGYHVEQILSQPGTVAGAFRLHIRGAFPGLRVIERLANFRSVRMGMPYGDQAIFMKADRFQRMGGFPEIPIMEDFELMRRLRRQGRVGIAPVAAVTSDRRYREMGFLRTTGVNQLMIAAYLAGVPTDRLAQWYRTGLKKKTGPPNRQDSSQKNG